MLVFQCFKLQYFNAIKTESHLQKSIAVQFITTLQNIFIKPKNDSVHTLKPSSYQVQKTIE